MLLPVLALTAGESLRAALDFTTGVLTLLTLSGAVIWGLIATDRLLLGTRQRLLAQGVHRAIGIASLGFLLLHITTKVADGHTSAIGALIPFGLGIQGSAGLIGLGSLAGYLMIIAGSTGALRSAFATPGQTTAGRWRAIHALAYPAWCAALVHGLKAGRPAAGWVVAMYALCLLAVAAAVGVRMLPRPQRRRIAQMLLSVIQPGVDTMGAPPPAETSHRDSSVSPLPGAGPRPGLFDGPASVPASPPLDSTRATPIGPGYGGAGISAGYRAVSSTGPLPQVPRPPQPSRRPSAESYVQSYLDPPEPDFPPYAEQPTQQLPPSPGADPFGDPLTAPMPPMTDPLTEPVPQARTDAFDTGSHDFTESYPRVPPQPAGPPSSRWPSPSPPPPSQHIRASAEPDPPQASGPNGPRPPGPSYPPPPGEPWHEPAGDRP